MKKDQFEQLKAIVQGAKIKPPVALLVDSPWIPPFVGIGAMEYFTEPDKWLEANLHVVERFPDVIFIPGFWVEYGMAIEPSAHGCKVSWWKDSPPSVSPVLSDISEVSRLTVPSPQNDGLMPFVLHLQRRAQEQIAPMGYSIRIVSARGPLALATFIRGITEFLIDIKIEPENSHRLLDICTETVIRWLDAQAKNLPDVEAIFVLDDIVGLLSPADYEEFAHPYLKRIFNAFHGMLKLYHNDANIEPFAERLAETGFDILNFSHLIDAGELYRRIGDKVVLMGNVPPLQVLTEGTPEQVKESAKRALDGTGGRIILSAGGGTNPGTSAENIDALVQAAREWSESHG
ncbi:MAG: uroporphyrinogen decarboxylase family protein [Armatimonadetes bacterium]|nr:uroporphyrinogen decarboxylase family protein [Armatimonadota bacterium]